ncbi:MAG: thermonuclease family protein [Desulfobacterales bacterium]|nr:thermonuclease family protein [Desulfobacterales bacterium]
MRLEFDIERFDDYGRTLAYVFLPDGSMVNEKLLQAGMAYCLYKMPNVKYEARLLKAQREAMQDAAGHVAEVARRRGPVCRQPQLAAVPSGELPGSQAHLPRNRVVFSKRWDAFWAGYAPARSASRQSPISLRLKRVGLHRRPLFPTMP